MAATLTACNASSITVLEDFEAIRKRPAVHIGSTGELGLHHLVWEMAGNAVDEAMGRIPDQGRVTLLADGGVQAPTTAGYPGRPALGGEAADGGDGADHAARRRQVRRRRVPSRPARSSRKELRPCHIEYPPPSGLVPRLMSCLTVALTLPRRSSWARSCCCGRRWGPRSPRFGPGPL
jgi:hypothetical protein